MYKRNMEIRSRLMDIKMHATCCRRWDCCCHEPCHSRICVRDFDGRYGDIDGYDDRNVDGLVYIRHDYCNIE